MAVSVLYFSVYVMEDLLPPADRKMLLGCTGSRRSLRGGLDVPPEVNRCTIRELAEYIWDVPKEIRELWNTDPSKLPGGLPEAPHVDANRKNHIHWRAAASEPDPSKYRLTTAQNAVMVISEDVLQTDGTRINQPMAGAGYTGDIVASRVLQGETRYFELIQNLGEHQKSVRVKSEAILDSDAFKLEDIHDTDSKEVQAEKKARNKVKTDARSHFARAVTLSENASSLTHLLRLKDVASFQINKGGIKKHFKGPDGLEKTPKSKPYPIPTYTEAGTGTKPLIPQQFKVLDEEATVKAFSSYGFPDEAAARAALEQAKTAFNSTPKGREHKKALDGINRARNGILGGCRLPAEPPI